MKLIREFNSVTEIRSYLRALQDMKEQGLLAIDFSPKINLMQGCVQLELEVTPHEKI